MIIQTCDHSYRVIRCLDSTEETVEYLCREIRRSKGGLCLLVCIRDQVLAKSFTLFLEEKINKEEFTDYRECFRSEGNLYAVFAFGEGVSLAERLAGEHLSLPERLQIAGKLFERLLIQNPHPFFAASVLSPERITVSRSLHVEWNYHLEHIRKFDRMLLSDAADRLTQVLEDLFARELEKKLYPELDGYLDALVQGSFSSYLEMYQAFLPVSEVLLKVQQEERTPQTFWFRLWEKIRTFAGFLKRVLMVLLVAATILYVVFVLLDDSG